MGSDIGEEWGSVPMLDRRTGDLVDLLLAQHREIEQRLEEVASATGEARETAFSELYRVVYAHETGEQEVMHPAVRDLLHDADTAEARITEEAAAGERLVELRGVLDDEVAFGPLFLQVRESITAHARAEESNEFPRLRRLLSAERLHILGNSLRAFQSTADEEPARGFGAQQRFSRTHGSNPTP